jgi:hypothetical protein
MSACPAPTNICSSTTHTSVSHYHSHLFLMSCYQSFLFLTCYLSLHPVITQVFHICPANPCVLLPVISLMSCLSLCPATTHTCSLCPAYPSVLLPPIPILMSCSPLCPAKYYSYLFLMSRLPLGSATTDTHPYVPPTAKSCYHSYLFLMSRLPLGPATTNTCPYVPLTTMSC